MVRSILSNRTEKGLYILSKMNIHNFWATVTEKIHSPLLNPFFKQMVQRGIASIYDDA